MQVVILAGGLGTRLRPLTHTVPKPMVPVGGRPFLERQIAWLAGQGFRKFLLLTGYLGEQVEKHFGDGEEFGVQIRYAREEVPMGTGGALRGALAELEPRFLLLYGDSFLPVNYEALGAALAESPDAGGIMALFDDPLRATGVAANVALGPGDVVTRYAKGESGDDLRFIEAGALGLAAREIESLPDATVTSLEKQLYPRLVAQERMLGWVTSQRFYDIGTSEGLGRAEDFFLAQETT